MPDAIETPVMIDASPTKDLFIEMLTRDVPLLWAILDVVDNSVDAAKARSINGDLSPFKITITLNTEFLILDNCGGLSRNDAISHAFRFGRDSRNPATPFSVGQFGVGMKRTLFKLGDDFCVDSMTSDDSFRVQVNVSRWRQLPKWEFPIESTPGGEALLNHGLRIRVFNLHDVISLAFGDQTFINELREEIRRSHFMSIDRGLTIEVNGVVLSIPDIGIKASASVTPYHKKMVFTVTGAGDVSAEIWAGVSQRDPELAGWYVFCNERMVLAADQSFTTGWGEGGGRTVPKFHNDFAYFRGYVMFQAQDPKHLPWTSMKTGLDTDSKVYAWCKEAMITAMRGIIKALRDLAREKSERKVVGLRDGRLESAIETAPLVKFAEIATDGVFTVPDPELPVDLVETESSLNILYQKPRDEVERAKASLGVDSAKAVGEKTFEYYMKYGV